MMKAIVHFFSIVVFLFVAGGTKTAVCEILNGSFEDDGQIVDIGQTEPNGWAVDVPSGKFSGYVYRDWPTDGIWNLTVYSQRASFEAGDMATVSQDVVLSNVGAIIFDLKVDSDWSAWDPNICSAVVLIDGDVAWTSDGHVPDAEGRYFDQSCPVEQKYRAPGAHKLSLGLRVNAPGMLWERYYTDWDLIECTLLCGGGGVLPGDFNGDCFVDVDDLTMLTAMWLGDVVSDSPYNLSGIDDEESRGTVNFFDLAVFGDSWLGSSVVQEE